MRILTIANSKGGSSKTTMTVCLASEFAERGLRVLVVDLDPQGSATRWLGAAEAPCGLVELSEGTVRVADLVRHWREGGLDVIPTSPSLVADGQRSDFDTGLAIIRGFARLPDYWDLVLVDTPPGTGYLALAPLVASDDVVVPAEARALALTGVASVMSTIQRAKRNVNRKLRLVGIVPSRVNATTHSHQVVARLRAEYGDAVLDHVVRESIRVAEAPALRVPIAAYAPWAPTTVDFRDVAGELLERIGPLEP
ncbi:MAG TPA: ParA family protein [Candidatus Dormibacteraeota bacterium]|nr:ParA family protein [Candidatus Dormibacteraeota bacterium]